MSKIGRNNPNGKLNSEVAIHCRRRKWILDFIWDGRSFRAFEGLGNFAPIKEFLKIMLDRILSLRFSFLASVSGIVFIAFILAAILLNGLNPS